MAELSEGEAEADFVRQLRAIGGVNSDTSDFFVSINGGPPIHVAYSSGSGSNVAFTVPYGRGPVPAISDDLAAYRTSAGGVHRAHRPMEITLRRENEADVQAKHAGIAVEHQSGDGRFDASVYIDTEASDETLRYVLSSPVLRQAIVMLLDEGASRVVLDEHESIKTSILVFASRNHDENRARRVLEAIDAIARNAPPVEHSNEGPRTDPQRAWVGVVGFFAACFVFFGIPLYFALVPSRCWMASSDGDGASLNCEVAGCCSPMLPGAALGALIGTVLAPLVASRVRGRSDSHHRRGIALIGVWVDSFAITLALVSVYYWYFRR